MLSLGEKKDKKLFKNINYTDIELIVNLLIYYFIMNDLDANIHSQTIFKLIDFLINYSEYVKNNFIKIFLFLDSYSKNEIFKLSIQIEQKNISSEQLDTYTKIVYIYEIIIESFQFSKILIYKHLSTNLELIKKLMIFYTNIIEIYDGIQDNLFKIRKLSNSKSDLKNIFLKINTTFINIRKCGYFKKIIL